MRTARRLLAFCLLASLLGCSSSGLSGTLTFGEGGEITWTPPDGPIVLASQGGPSPRAAALRAMIQDAEAELARIQ